MNLRLKFLQWLYTPQLMREIYLKEEIPKTGETVYIPCQVMERYDTQPAFWKCTIENFDKDYKFLRREKIELNLPLGLTPSIKIYYDKFNNIRGSVVMWQNSRDRGFYPE